MDSTEDHTAADSGAMRRRLLTLAAIVIGLDLVSKQVMLALIFDPPRRIDVLPFLNFAPVWNPGISFGMLADGGDVLRYLLTVLALAVAGWLIWKAPQFQRLERLGAGLIAGGAIGNAIDRLRFGKVVDFIDVYVQTWHWPAFNIADAAITIGAGLWICSILVERETDSS
jgi:signal peptidase II